MCHTIFLSNSFLHIISEYKQNCLLDNFENFQYRRVSFSLQKKVQLVKRVPIKSAMFPCY